MPAVSLEVPFVSWALVDWWTGVPYLFLIMRTFAVVIDGGICFLIILIVKYGHLAK